MFRKVQWKFFAFTTSILLAIFIVLLTAINLIMQSVMQRQSIVVLRQIASSVEYDDETDSFVYFETKDRPSGEPKDDRIHDKHDNEEKPPSIQTTAVSVSSDSKTTTSTVRTTTTIEDEKQKSTDKPEEKDNQPSEKKSESNSSATENSKKNQNSATPAVTTAVASSSGKTITQAVQVPTNAPAAATKAAQTPTSPAAATKAAETPASPQVTTKTAQPATSANTPSATEPATAAPQQSQDDESSQYPWMDWEEWNNWHEGNNGDIPDDFVWGDEYPDFYDREDNEWDGRKRSYYNEDEAEQQSYYPEDEDIVQLAGSLDSVLDGYTVLSESADISKTMEEARVPKSLGSIDFFVLMADVDGNFLASLNNDELTDETAQEYINGVIKNCTDEGMLDTLQYFQLEKENGTIMVFTDKSAELDMLTQLMHTTVAIGIISFILLSILTYFLSKKSIQPVKVAFEKQKQFISDASHELKTPLTIISANADILADEVGKNKWLEYIKSQTDRMNVLVNELLNLTRLENNTANIVFCEFDLSKAIENTALPFECQAFDSKKTFDIDIQEGLSISGSEVHVKQMAAIFIDNALKYSNDGGTVRITLKSQGDKKILSVFNTGAGIKEGEENKIFERFYRSDDSRARTTGGYGLGLAIAKSIIDKHKFKLTIDNVPGESICFNVTM